MVALWICGMVLVIIMNQKRHLNFLSLNHHPFIIAGKKCGAEVSSFLGGQYIRNYQIISNGIIDINKNQGSNHQRLSEQIGYVHCSITLDLNI